MLPTLRNKAEYLGVLRDDEVWRAALRTIAERHGLETAQLRRAATGSHVVALTDAAVVKLFAPWWPDDFTAERRMLEHVDGRLPILTPRIFAAGELEGWPYLVFTRLPGSDLGPLWRTLAPTEQQRLLGQLGELAAALHELPLLPVDGDPVAMWAEFVALRRQRLSEKHSADGLPPAWVADIERTVASLPPLECGMDQLACLHTDLHPGNLLARSVGDRLELSGMYDFGDAMIGAREHELIAPAAFMAAAVPGGLRALLSGYGYADPERDHGLVMRLTGHLLLQRYCALPGVMGRLEPRPGDLAALLARLWAGLPSLARAAAAQP